MSLGVIPEMWLPACYPCLADNRYIGCIGRDVCQVPRCWNGERISGPLEARDCSDPETDVAYVPGCQCVTCAHVVDVDGSWSRPGRPATGWVTCGKGLWCSPATEYNLARRRVPIKLEAEPPCPSYCPTAQLRPEVRKRREQDRLASARRRVA